MFKESLTPGPELENSLGQEWTLIVSDPASHAGADCAKVMPGLGSTNPLAGPINGAQRFGAS